MVGPVDLKGLLQLMILQQRNDSVCLSLKY